MKVEIPNGAVLLNRAIVDKECPRLGVSLRRTGGGGATETWIFEGAFNNVMTVIHKSRREIENPEINNGVTWSPSAAGGPER